MSQGNEFDLSGVWVHRPDPNDVGATAGWSSVLEWWDRFGTLTLPAGPGALTVKQHYGPAWIGRVFRPPRAWLSAGAGDLRLVFAGGVEGTWLWINGIELDGQADGRGLVFDVGSVMRDDPSGWPAGPKEAADFALAVRVPDVKVDRLTQLPIRLVLGG